MRRLVSIGMIAVAIACSEPNPLAMGDTSSGTTDGTSTMSTSGDPTTTTMPTTTMSTMTMSTSGDPTTETTDDTTTSPVDTSTGAAACDTASHQCLGDPPEDWKGPVAIVSNLVADPEPPCAAPYDELVTDTYVGLDRRAAHDCACTCGEPQGVGCSVTLWGDNSNNCLSPLGNAQVSEACTNLPGSLEIAGNSYWRAIANVVDGSCDAFPDHDIEPATFTERLLLCEGEPGLGECPGGESCTPLPAAENHGRVCVWRLGEFECPGDPWTQQTLTHREIDDGRTCTPCTCGDADGECDGSITLVGTNDCSGGGLAIANIGIGGDCIQGQTAPTVQGAYSSPLTPIDPQCASSGSIPSGFAVEAAPLTLCCLETE